MVAFSVNLATFQTRDQWIASKLRHRSQNFKDNNSNIPNLLIITELVIATSRTQNTYKYHTLGYRRSAHIICSIWIDTTRIIANWLSLDITKMIPDAVMLKHVSKVKWHL